MANPEFLRKVAHSRQQARALRQSAQAVRARTAALIRRAIALCGYKRLEQIAARWAITISETAPRARQRLQVQQAEVIDQLKQSLSDLENIRMIPADSPELRDLKEDIRQTIKCAESGNAYSA